MNDYTRPVLKALFALSCNSCAYPGCEQPLANPDWPTVMAEIAHIRGKRPGSARYDDSMTDEERWGFENLILLCPTHHKLVDDLESAQHPAELVRDYKRRHEEACGKHNQWTDSATMERYAVLAAAAVEAEASVKPYLTDVRTQRNPIIVTAPPVLAEATPDETAETTASEPSENSTSS